MSKLQLADDLSLAVVESQRAFPTAIVPPGLAASPPAGVINTYRTSVAGGDINAIADAVEKRCCQCDHHTKAWNPNTGKCESCGRWYLDTRRDASPPPAQGGADGAGEEVDDRHL